MPPFPFFWFLFKITQDDSIKSYFHFSDNFYCRCIILNLSDLENISAESCGDALPNLTLYGIVVGNDSNIMNNCWDWIFHPDQLVKM